MAEKPSAKLRLDKMLFEKGLAESREKAKALILEGNVLVNGLVVDKAGALVKPGDALAIKSRMPYVSRGGLKLEDALCHFHINVTNKIAADVGASTGGFTDCLLQHHARKVYAIDVGYGQFSWKLRTDDRVVLLEKTNIRYLDNSLIGDIIDLATVDVSFISLMKVLPKVMEILKPEGDIIALIKPQFEAGRKDVGKGGVVRDEHKRQEVIESVQLYSETIGLTTLGVRQSPIKGPKGNIEYLIHLKKNT